MCSNSKPSSERTKNKQLKFTRGRLEVQRSFVAKQKKNKKILDENGVYVYDVPCDFRPFTEEIKMREKII